MRELKIRAFDTEANSYVKDPILVDNFGNVYVVCEEASDKRGTCLITGKPNVILEQYTGLKDKNGKEIYEGDIVKSSYRITGDSEPTYYYHLVEWEVQPMDDYCGDITVGLWLPDTNEAVEVVGNIHENPELLEEK